jgi:isopenicillin N synthase-like dioxygenase
MGTTIPVVDLRHLAFAQDDPRRIAFIQTLGHGLETVGFVAVEGHGVSPELLQRVYAVAREAFSLAADIKSQYEAPEIGRQRGYTPMGLERARHRSVADLKEFWMVGRPSDPDLPANLFPGEAPAFAPVLSDYFHGVEAAAALLLGGIGEYLDLGAGYFQEMVRGGNSVVRVLNYPDAGGPVAAGAVRAAAHEDINLITLLPASTRPGLELLDRDGAWVAVETPPDVLIVDTGDMMELVTAGRLAAVTHRVVNPESSDGGRMSLPFFVHPRPSYVLTPVKPGYAEPIGAHEFLMQRLRENGVA